MTLCEAFTKAMKEGKAFGKCEDCIQYRVVHWCGEPHVLQFDAGTGEIGKASSFTAGEFLEDDWEVLE